MNTKTKDDTANTAAVTEAKTNTPKQPRLGDLVKVKGNKQAPPRMDDLSFFPTDKPVEIKVTTRIIKLLRDGDLTLA